MVFNCRLIMILMNARDFVSTRNINMYMSLLGTINFDQNAGRLIKSV